MTKKQLIEKLKDVPDDMDIFLQQTNTEFSFSLLEFAEVKVATFTEGIEGGLKATDKVCVLSDEI